MRVHEDHVAVIVIYCTCPHEYKNSESRCKPETWFVRHCETKGIGDEFPEEGAYLISARLKCKCLTISSQHKIGLSARLQLCRCFVSKTI